MNQKPTSLMNDTSRKLIKRARDAARRSVAAYLEMARTGGMRQRKRALEAVAIKRALITDILEELAGETQRSAERDAKRNPSVSVLEADRMLFAASDRLYRNCEDSQVKRLARDLRVSVFGLGAERVLGH